MASNRDPVPWRMPGLAKASKGCLMVLKPLTHGFDAYQVGRECGKGCDLAAKTAGLHSR